jgi:glyoxylase-like metal-dependent hydrolase (beta-lactamase superfamily II)
MENLKLFLLSDGCFILDKSFLVYTKYQGRIYEAALKPLLIITGKENILVDTGIGQLPEKYEKFHRVKRGRDQTLKAQLEKHDLTPRDISIVVNTHLHFDHCGNNHLFPKAKFYVQTKELRYAHAPDRFQKAAYIRDFFDINIEYTPIQGKYRVTNNVILVPTPGHSPGHQSVLIEMEGKSYVYCGDAAPLRENLEQRNIPGVLYRADEALKSIDVLRAIKNAVYIYSHDNEQLTLI